jgi:hypothetical protein
MKTASNIETAGTLTVDGASTLTGAATLASTISVTGASTLAGAVAIAGAASTATYTGLCVTSAIMGSPAGLGSQDYSWMYFDGTNIKAAGITLYDTTAADFVNLYMDNGTLTVA